MLEQLGAISFPENLNTQIITGIESAFSNGLTFVAPILVGMVGITIVRKVINRGKNGRV
jgi:hypothetical protein